MLATLVREIGQTHFRRLETPDGRDASGTYHRRYRRAMRCPAEHYHRDLAVRPTQRSRSRHTAAILPSQQPLPAPEELNTLGDHLRRRRDEQIRRRAAFTDFCPIPSVLRHIREVDRLPVARSSLTPLPFGTDVGTSFLARLATRSPLRAPSLRFHLSFRHQPEAFADNQPRPVRHAAKRARSGSS